MKQMIFALFQLGFVATWAILNDIQPQLTFLDTSEMAQFGSTHSKVQLVASFDPTTSQGQKFYDQLSTIKNEFIDKGFVCYYELKEEGKNLEIFINGQDKTQDVFEKSLRSCLSNELLREF
jgi:hypothetical protein